MKEKAKPDTLSMVNLDLNAIQQLLEFFADTDAKVPSVAMGLMAERIETICERIDRIDLQLPEPHAAHHPDPSFRERVMS